MYIKTERIVYIYRPLQMSLLLEMTVTQSFWTIQTINNTHYTIFFIFMIAG